MTEFTMKSTFTDKCREAVYLLKSGGLTVFLKKCVRYIKHLFGAQSRFAYFVFSLDQPFPNFYLKDIGSVRIAEPEDSGRIQAELFPFITEEEENDKRYFKLLGRPGVSCFIAEKEGILVHYTWLFWDARRSPLIDTPFSKALIREGDAYVGPAFTSSIARGTWIYPHVLVKVLSFAKETANRKRIILFVNGKNLSAINFFVRLGFQRL